MSIFYNKRDIALYNETFLKRNSRLENSLRHALEKRNKELVRYYSYLLYSSYKNESNYNLSHCHEYINRSFIYYYNYCSLSISDFFENHSSVLNKQIKITSLLSQIRHPDFICQIEDNTENLLKEFRESIGFKQFNFNETEKDYFNIVKSISLRQKIPLGILKFLLFSESQLDYLQSILLYFVSIKNTEKHFVNMMRESCHFAFKSTYYYPMNSSPYNVLHLSPFYDQDDRLAFNHYNMLLSNYMCNGFNNEGIRLNQIEEYTEAERVYSQGLNVSLPGSKNLLYYNAAKNYQDQCYSINQFNNREIDLSIIYSYESIYDLMIDLDFYIKPFSEERYRVDRWLNCISLIGLSLEKKGNRKEAIALLYSSLVQYYKLVQNNTGTNQIIGDCHNNLGLFYMREMNYSNALEHFHRALEKNPQRPGSALLNISNCYYQLGQYKSAISICNRLISNSDIIDSHHDALYNQILSYSKMKMLNKILEIEDEYLANAVENEPLFLAKVYKDLNDDTSFQRCLLKAEKNKSPEYFYFLSFIEKDSGNISESKKHFEAFLSSSVNQMINDCKKFNKEAFNATVFYKFKKVNCNTLNMLQNNYLYFSDFSKLNDPFDCRLISEYKNNSSMDSSFIKIGDPKIMSLSMTGDNPLLWSHYADEHRGICIGYNFNLDSLISNNVISNIVKYSESIIPLHEEILENLYSIKISEVKKTPLPSNKHLLNAMIVKSKEWEYEQEFRLISFADSKLLNKDLFSISSVDFGYLCSFKDIRSVLQKMRKGYGESTISQDSSNSVIFGNMKVIFSKKNKSSKAFFELEDDPIFNIVDYL